MVKKEDRWTLVHVPSLIFYDNFFETTCAELFIECHGCTPGLMQDCQDNILIKPSTFSINEAAERDAWQIYERPLHIAHPHQKQSNLSLRKKNMTVHKTKTTGFWIALPWLTHSVGQCYSEEIWALILIQVMNVGVKVGQK